MTVAAPGDLDDLDDLLARLQARSTDAERRMTAHASRLPRPRARRDATA